MMLVPQQKNRPRTHQSGGMTKVLACHNLLDLNKKLIEIGSGLTAQQTGTVHAQIHQQYMLLEFICCQQVESTTKIIISKQLQIL